MLALKRMSAAGFYKPGTGERGIHCNNRIKVGKTTFDALYGYKLDSVTAPYVNAVMSAIGYPKLAPMVHCVNTIPSDSHYGVALLTANQVILYRHTLGVLVHELAHFAAFAILNEAGHQAGFKAMYIMLHAATYQVLKLDGERMYRDMIVSLQEFNILGA